MDKKTDTPQIVTEIQEGGQDGMIKNEKLKESTSDGLIDTLKLLKGKSYAPKTVNELILLRDMDADLLKQMAELAKKLDETYNINLPNFDVFKHDLLAILHGGNLEKKLELLKGKSYAPKTVNDMLGLSNMGIDELKSRIEIATDLEKRGKKVSRFYFFSDYHRPSERIRKKLRRKKLKLLKGMSYTPAYYEESKKLLIDKLDTNEVSRRVELARRLQREYGVKLITHFSDFKGGLSKIVWSEELKDKLELLKGKSYAPKTVDEVLSLSKIDMNEIQSRVELATKLEQRYNIKINEFGDFDLSLFIISWSEELKDRLELLRGKSYAPQIVNELLSLSNMDINEIQSRVELATKLEQKYNLKITNFPDFRGNSWKIKLEGMDM